MADEVTRHRTSSPKPCPPGACPPGTLPTHTPQKFDHRMETGITSSTDQQTMDRSHEVSLDINELAISLRDRFKTNKAFSRECCIYRVPARLRRLNEEAYTPRVVSIGPFHHGKENLKAMEDHKIMYLQQFLELSKVSVEDLINVVKDNETELRDCYAGNIDLSRKDFATMILLDAVFVIMVLLKRTWGEYHESRIGDQIFFRPFKINDVVFDMCLLENQLPFFFLERMFELYPRTNRTIIELTFGVLQGKLPNWVKEGRRGKINPSGVLHFVDFLRKCQQPTEQHPPAEKPTFIRALTAMELHQRGVLFMNPGRNSLFDIRFSDGILEIPQLTIDDRTEILFRNLQAFEQCHHMSEDKFVNDYISFIRCLIRAPNDVKVLAHNANLENMLNSDEAVSNFLDNLNNENVVSECSFLWGVYKELTLHYRKYSHRYYTGLMLRWKETLKEVYNNSTWTILISIAGGTSLLILTVIQTVCSILQL